RNQEGALPNAAASISCRGRGNSPWIAAAVGASAKYASPLQDRGGRCAAYTELGGTRQISLWKHGGAGARPWSARIAGARHARGRIVHLAGNPARIAVVPPPAAAATDAGRRQDHNDRQNHQPLHTLAPENGRAGRGGPFRQV